MYFYYSTIHLRANYNYKGVYTIGSFNLGSVLGEKERETIEGVTVSLMLIVRMSE